MSDEQEPNVVIHIEAQRQHEWGTSVTFRYWVDGQERPPLTAFQADHLAAVLRYVGTLIRERSGKATEVESAQQAMVLAQGVARKVKAEWEALVAATSEKGVHHAASEHGIRQSEVRAIRRRVMLPEALS